jgi:hypothetical protein
MKAIYDNVQMNLLFDTTGEQLEASVVFSPDYLPIQYNLEHFNPSVTNPWL